MKKESIQTSYNLICLKVESHLISTKAFQELENESKIRETALKASIEAMQKALEKDRERANRAEAQQLNSERINLKITEEVIRYCSL